MIDQIANFEKFLNENSFSHEIKSESYWRKIIGNNKYATDVLDTIMKKQNGKASARQMAILRRAESGDNSPYPTKN